MLNVIIAYLCRIHIFAHFPTCFYLYFFQRMDLGDCPNIHDLAYKADYERAAKSKDYYYDIDVRIGVGRIKWSC